MAEFCIVAENPLCEIENYDNLHFGTNDLGLEIWSKVGL